MTMMPQGSNDITNNSIWGISSVPNAFDEIQHAHHLEVGIEDSATIPFDKFLSVVFHLSPDWELRYPDFNTIESTTWFQDLGGDCWELYNLNNRYSLGEHRTTVCSDNVPRPYSFSHQQGSEYVITYGKLLERINRNGLSKDGPGHESFHSSDILAFIELFSVKDSTSNIPSVSARLQKRKRTQSSRELESERLKSSSSTSTRRCTELSITTSTSSANPVAASSCSRLVPTFQHSFHTSESISPKQPREYVGAPSKREKSDVQPPASYDALNQCVLEMLSPNLVLGAQITNGELELLYRERSFRSEPVDVLENPSSLVVFPYYTQLPTSRPPFDHLSLLTVTTYENLPELTSVAFDVHCSGCLNLEYDKGAYCKLGNPIYVQQALIGRRTCMARVSITRNDHSTQSWAFHSLPAVLPRQAFPANNVDPVYLPREGVEYEEGVRRILVTTELFHITKLTTTETLVPVIRDIFSCYRSLYENAKIMHRDISLNNLMFCKNPDGSSCGVLSDFDLSLSLARQGLGPSSRQRTGTTPYTAIDLLGPFPMKHLYRHDLESLFYVLIVLTTGYHEGRAIADPPLQAWFDPRAHLHEKKITFIHQLSIPQPTPNFAQTKFLSDDLKVLFAKGYTARTLHPGMVRRIIASGAYDLANLEFDESTLGGHIDFQAFADVLFQTSELNVP